VDADVKSLDISDNYFENNNKVDNGNAQYADVVIKSGHQIGPVQLANNYVWMTFPKDKARDFVACYSTRGGLRLTNNHLTKSSIHLAPSALLRTATTAAGADNILERLVISGTFAERFTDAAPYSALVVDSLAGGVTELHDAVIDDVFKANYAPPLLRFAPVSRPVQGTWRKSAEKWRRLDVWMLSGAANAGQWGFAIDLDDHPELAGKLVYFACMAKASAPGTTVELSTSQLGPQQAGPAPDQQWQLLSYVDRLPDSGTVTFSVGAVLDDPAGAVSFAHPVLSEVGVPYRLQDPA
jgi:hypothetical protein